ncbi:hypothetical protein A4H97_20360 [Niastella yeongjuensis]|uniref:Uncharacterized protein n=1 Tax=Niastella yeongjuensis TaxID=354355 RepID=A0A1V9FC24_9BACT|nr:hypothetical protein A4H97_20360 [Niastella yeongjuensis]
MTCKFNFEVLNVLKFLIKHQKKVKSGFSAIKPIWARQAKFGKCCNRFCGLNFAKGDENQGEGNKSSYKLFKFDG